MIKNSNIIQFNADKKWHFRRFLLKNAQKGFAQKIALQIKNKAANDNLDLKGRVAEDLLKIY